MCIFGSFVGEDGEVMVVSINLEKVGKVLRFREVRKFMKNFGWSFLIEVDVCVGKKFLL